MFDCIVFGPVPEACPYLKDGYFDVIISDFSLPGIDGFEFLKIANRYCPESIKIMVVGYGDVDPMSKVFKYGIDDVIEKPFPYESLLYTNFKTSG